MVTTHKSGTQEVQRH